MFAFIWRCCFGVIWMLCWCWGRSGWWSCLLFYCNVRHNNIFVMYGCCMYSFFIAFMPYFVFSMFNNMWTIMRSFLHFLIIVITSSIIFLCVLLMFFFLCLFILSWIASFSHQNALLRDCHLQRNHFPVYNLLTLIWKMKNASWEYNYDCKPQWYLFAWLASSGVFTNMNIFLTFENISVIWFCNFLSVMGPCWRHSLFLLFRSRWQTHRLSFIFLSSFCFPSSVKFVAYP